MRVRPTLSAGFGAGFPALYVTLSLACEQQDTLLEQRAEPAPLVSSSARWELTFSDEFTGPSGTSPAPDKWQPEVGTGWGNQQLEYDTARTDNVALDGEGHLAITARREAYGGKAFSSGRLSTKGLFEQTYGRFEARMKPPQGSGLWPAFWLLGTDRERVGWPECGEVDIMEFRGQNTDEVRSSLHAPGYSGGENLGLDVTFDGENLADDYHLYAVEWTSQGFAFYVDQRRTFRVLREELVKTAAWPFDRPFFVILNLAVGGTYVGPPSEDAPFPQALLVDYVRIYRLAEP